TPCIAVAGGSVLRNSAHAPSPSRWHGTCFSANPALLRRLKHFAAGSSHVESARTATRKTCTRHPSRGRQGRRGGGRAPFEPTHTASGDHRVPGRGARPRLDRRNVKLQALTCAICIGGAVT